MMKAIKHVLLWLSLFPSALLGQTQELPTAEWPADSIVLVVPFPELAVQRLDALVDDSLMEVSQLGLMVWDLTADTQIYARSHRQLMRTASTMKLLTAITALDQLGADYKFTTSLYYNGNIERGVLVGDLICRGGMDPMFSWRDLQAFVKAVKSKGITAIRGRIVSDVSMKDGDKWGEGWCWDDDNPTLSPLLVEGKANFAEQLQKELRAARVNTAAAKIVTDRMPASAKHLSTITHSMDEVLPQMMKESDNLYAEATYYQVAASSGKRPATAKDAQKTERELFTKIGLQAERYRLADGSGLSLYDYLSAEAQVMLLRYAWQNQPIYQHLLPSLPIAGVDGTLKKRMNDTPAQNNVRAKTGSVTGVSALSGYCTAPNGHQLCFSIINQGVRHMAEARDFQDRVCTALCAP